MPELTRPTVTIHYEDSAVGDQAIVFLHGWCDGSASWASTIEEMQTQYRCISLDMRGHGLSGQPRDFCYSMEALANDVVALCESLGVSKPVLVGHSFGGMLAALLLSRYPGFARGLVIEDQSLDFLPFAAQMRSAEGVIRGADSHLQFRERLLGSMVTAEMPAEATAMLDALQKATSVGVALALWAPLFEFSDAEMAEFSKRLLAVLASQPTALIDAQEPPGYYENVRSVAPEAKIWTLGGGHWTHLEKPTEFVRALREFVESL